MHQNRFRLHAAGPTKRAYVATETHRWLGNAQLHCGMGRKERSGGDERGEWRMGRIGHLVEVT